MFKYLTVGIAKGQHIRGREGHHIFNKNAHRENIGGLCTVASHHYVYL